MFRFAHPEYLYGLAVLPVLFVLYLWAMRSRRRALKAYGNPDLLSSLMPGAGSKKTGWKAVLAFVAVALLLLGIANPEIGTKLEEVKGEGVDIFICLDVSLSMKCEDIKPNRLENAKREISLMLDKLQGDRVGLIVFAGDAYVQLPLTTDYGAARLMLSAVDVDAVPVPGTAIGSAIRMAMKSFVEGEHKHKAIIIITDGENHEDDAVAAAKDAAAEGVVVHTLGMGSVDGGPIPIYNDNVQTGFKKDNTGAVVVTKLDPAALQEIADAGNGTFVRGSNEQSQLDVLYKKIQSMEKKEFGSKVVTDYEERFQWLLAAAFFALLFEFFLSERKNPFLVRLKDIAAKPFTFRVTERQKEYAG
jgi:Ca-activated chloride channel family protein